MFSQPSGLVPATLLILAIAACGNLWADCLKVAFDGPLQLTFSHPAQRLTLMRRSIILGALAVVLTGCSDRTIEQDFAACTMKTYEVHKERPVWDETPAVYLQECMRAAGYKLDYSCDDKHAGRSTVECYYADTWWERWKRG